MADDNKLSDLFKQLGLDHLSPQSKVDMSEDMSEIVMNRVADRLETLLTPDQAAEIEALLRTDDASAFKLLERFVPEYPAIIAEEIESFQDDILSTQDEVLKLLKNKPQPPVS